MLHIQQLQKLFNDPESRWGKIVELLLLSINLFACVLFVIESYYPDAGAGVGERSVFLNTLDWIVVSFFIAEYVLRLLVSEKPLRFVFSFYGLVDILSILPSFMSGSLVFLRALRVLRVLRFIRYLETESFFFGRVSGLRLQAIRTMFTVFSILFIAAGFILYAEKQVPAATITQFDEAFYFCVVTLATVGFGDFVPITTAGRWITMIMILMGMVLVPWQGGKLVRQLLRSERRTRHVVCPQCGLTEHDPDASHCKACGHVIFQEYSGNRD